MRLLHLRQIVEHNLPIGLGVETLPDDFGRGAERQFDGLTAQIRQGSITLDGNFPSRPLEHRLLLLLGLLEPLRPLLLGRRTRFGKQGLGCVPSVRRGLLLLSKQRLGFRVETLGFGQLRRNRLFRSSARLTIVTQNVFRKK